MKLLGLEAMRGSTPRARRAALLRLDDAELGQRLASMVAELRAGTTVAERKRLALLAGLPLGDVVASPIGMRMVAMAVELGATTVHQELRASLPTRAKASAATRSRRSIDDERHGRWEHGALHAGKYQQFGLEDPLAVFHPDHTSKWGPHELMHRAAGFFHRAGASRFERYLGARLNELLPVVTWYGLEQALRLDEGDFDRGLAGLRKEAEPRRALWLSDRRRTKAELEGAGRLLREGLLHLERELRAIDEEITSGELVRVEHPFLDASSDALAYVAAHASFLESEAADEVLLRFARPGIERFATIPSYRAHVEQVADRLLFGTLELDEAAAASAIEARFAWDLAQRAVRAGTRTNRKLSLWLDEATTFAVQARAGYGLDDDDAAELRGSLRDAIGAASRPILANGDERFDDGLDLELLEAGLAETCSTVVRDVEVSSLSTSLARSPFLRRRLSLPDRVRAFLLEHGELALADGARFDAALARARTSDAASDELSTPPSRWPRRLETVVFRPSAAFELLALEHDVLDAQSPPRPLTVLVGRHRGALAVVPVPPSFAATWKTLSKGPIAGDRLIAATTNQLTVSATRARALLEVLASAGAIGARARVEASEDEDGREHR